MACCSRNWNIWERQRAIRPGWHNRWATCASTAAAGHMDYPRLRRCRLPQGSGAIESAIRRVINLRLKGPGLMWQKENAEGALALRAAAVTDRWEETMAWVRERMGQDRQVNCHWVSPDMLIDLKKKKLIKPPVPQKAVA